MEVIRRLSLVLVLGMLVSGLLSWLVSCESTQVENGFPPELRHYKVFDPGIGTMDQWEHYALQKTRTRYSMTNTNHGRLLMAEGRQSASILLRVLDHPAPLRCGRLSWSWRVEQLQPSAVLTDRRYHDFAASLLVAFGDLGIFRDQKVPTLQYAWTNGNVAADQIITGPYRRKHLRTIVVRRGDADSDFPVNESRDLIRDYERAFGKPPDTGVHAVAVFTDNDDTGEPVLAYYGPILLECEPPDA